MDDPNNEVSTYADSPYIPTENVENILSQYPNNFSVFRLNIQSLKSKFDSLLTFLSHLDENGYNFDTICLQETRLSPKCAHGNNCSIITGDFNIDLHINEIVEIKITLICL